MKRLLLSVSGLFLLAGGCAYIGAVGAAVYLSQDEAEEAVNGPPAASSSSAVAVSLTGTVTLHYALIDAESDPAGVTFEYSTDGGASFAPCTELTGSDSEGTASLAAGAGGSYHVYVWNAPADLTGYNRLLSVRVTPADAVTGAPGTAYVFPAFLWRYNAGPTVSVAVTGIAADRIPVLFTLADRESNPADVAVEFSTDGGVNFSTASEAASGESEGLAGLVTSATGVTHEFVWNSFADLGGTDLGVVLRVTPVDVVSGAAGLPGISGVFSVLNSRAVTVSGTGTESFGNVACVTADANGVLYFVERFGHRIYAHNPTAWPVPTLGVALNPGQTGCVAGTGTADYNGDHVLALQAALNGPSSLAMDTHTPPNLYIADTLNHRVRKIDGTTGFISTVAGDGTPGDLDARPALQARLNAPQGVACDVYGNVYIADTGNHVVRAVNLDVHNLDVGGSVVPPGHILSICGAFPPANPPLGDGGPAPSAGLVAPRALAFDGVGNLVIADTGHHRIRAINTANPALGSNPVNFGSVVIAAGDIDTIAGSGGQGFSGDAGPAISAGVFLDSPRGLTVLAGGILLFADTGNHAVRAVNLNPSSTLSVGSVSLPGGWIDTVAGAGGMAGSGGDGGPAPLAFFDGPTGVAQALGAAVVADGGNRRLRAFHPGAAPGSAPVSLAGKILEAGELDGIVSSPGFPVFAPSSVVLRGTTLFIADAGSHRIVKLDTLTGTMAPVAGNGSAGSSGDGGDALLAAFSAPSGLVADPVSGRVILVADRGNSRVRVVHFDTATGGSVTAWGVTVNAGEVETIPATFGQLNGPTGLAIASNGDLYIADTGGHRIVLVNRATGTLVLSAGSGTAGHFDGSPLASQFDSPEGVALSSTGNLYIADTGNHAIRLVNFTSSPVVYGSGTSQLTISAGTVGTLGGTPPSGGYDGDGREAWLSLLRAPVGIAVDDFGGVIFSERGNHRVRAVIAGSGSLSTLAGGGASGFNGDGNPLSDTLFDGPEGFALDGVGNLYLADRNNGRVRRFHP